METLAEKSLHRTICTGPLSLDSPARSFAEGPGVGLKITPYILHNYFRITQDNFSGYKQAVEGIVIEALCFGAIFGIPFIVWGLILIFDRERTWQKKLQRRANSPPQRTRAWDRRQILYGALLILFGAVLLIALTIFNFLAQAISPAPPF